MQSHTPIMCKKMLLQYFMITTLILFFVQLVCFKELGQVRTIAYKNPLQQCPIVYWALL